MVVSTAPRGARRCWAHRASLHHGAAWRRAVALVVVVVAALLVAATPVAALLGGWQRGGAGPAASWRSVGAAPGAAALSLEDGNGDEDAATGTRDAGPARRGDDVDDAGAGAPRGASDTKTPQWRHALRAVQLRLVDDDIVELVAGNPGRATRLRIDLGIDALLIFETLSQRSQTYAAAAAAVPGAPSVASELFYVGPYKLRLPVVLGAANPESASSVLYHQAAHAGVLGLGRRSPLWRYWSNYTLAGDVLLLGASAAQCAHMPAFAPPLALDTPLTVLLASLQQDAANDGADADATPGSPGIVTLGVHSTAARASVGEAAHAARHGTGEVLAPPSGAAPPGRWRWRRGAPAQLVLSLATPDSALAEPHFLAPFVHICVQPNSSASAPAPPSVAAAAAACSHTLLLNDAQHSVVTGAGFVYHALIRAAPRDAARLGATALRRFTLRVDIVRNEVALAAPLWGATGGAGMFAGWIGVAREHPAGTARGAGSSQRGGGAGYTQRGGGGGQARPGTGLDANLVGALLLLAAALAWLLVDADIGGAGPAQRGGAVDTQRCGVVVRRGQAMLQLYVHALALLLFALNTLGLGCAPLAAHYARASAGAVLGFLALCIGASALVGAAGTLGRAPRSAQRSALVLGAAAALWLALLSRHDDGAGAGAFMMFLAAAAAACGLLVGVLAPAARPGHHQPHRRGPAWRGPAWRAWVRGWWWFDCAAAAAAALAALRLNAVVLVDGGAGVDQRGGGAGYSQRGGASLDTWLPALVLWTLAVPLPALLFRVAYEMRDATAAVFGAAEK